LNLTSPLERSAGRALAFPLRRYERDRRALWGRKLPEFAIEALVSSPKAIAQGNTKTALSALTKTNDMMACVSTAPSICSAFRPVAAPNGERVAQVGEVNRLWIPSMASHLT
jgi:hypothetical protein